MNAAAHKLAGLSTSKLVDAFEATNSNNAKEIPVVRGWLMDELEKRDQAAFDAWTLSNADSPRRFFN